MAAVDDFLNIAAGMESPGTDIFAITPDDNNELSYVTRGIVFSTAGALRVLTMAGRDITLPDGLFAAGMIHPLRVKKVFATGTTATGIHGVI